MPAIGYSLPAVDGTARQHRRCLVRLCCHPRSSIILANTRPGFRPTQSISVQCSPRLLGRIRQPARKARLPLSLGGAFKDLSKTLRQVAKHLQRVSDAEPFHRHGQGLDPDLKWLRHWVNPKKRSDGGLRNRIGDSELVPFGQYEAYSSGRRFYERYADLFESEHVDVNLDYAQHSSWQRRSCTLQIPAAGSCPTQLSSSPPASYVSALQLHRYVRQDDLPLPGSAIPPTVLKAEKRPS